MIEVSEIQERKKFAAALLASEPMKFTERSFIPNDDGLFSGVTIEPRFQGWLLAKRTYVGSAESVKWPHEITFENIEQLIVDHQRDGQRNLAKSLDTSGSYLIRVAESFRWCLDKIAASNRQ